MKKNTHPPYQEVLFIDSASGHRFVCRSTMQPKAREKFEDREYPVVYLSISSTSHPLFTGTKQFVDAQGMIEKFNKRFEKKVRAVTPVQDEDKEENEVASDKPAAKKKK